MWAVVSLSIDSFVVPTPISVFKVLLVLLAEQETYMIVLGSMYRVLISLSIGIVLGTILGIFAGANGFIKRALQPIVIFIKSTPVVCFIIILWLYVDKELVPSICGVLLCFPIIYTNVSEGYKMVDRELINMSKVYKVPRLRILRKLYIPSILPYFFVGIFSSIGICWKATIAAEVISILDGSIGMQIYNGKVLLEFNHVFAWTLIIVFCSLLIELATKYIIKRLKFHKRFEVI